MRKFNCQGQQSKSPTCFFDSFTASASPVLTICGGRLAYHENKVSFSPYSLEKLKRARKIFLINSGFLLIGIFFWLQFFFLKKIIENRQ